MIWWWSSNIVPLRTCSFCEEAHKPESSMGAKVEAWMFLHGNWTNVCHMVQGWQTGLCFIQMQHKSNWKHLRFGISSRVWWWYSWKIFLWGYTWRWIRYLSCAGHPCDRLVNCRTAVSFFNGICRSISNFSYSLQYLFNIFSISFFNFSQILF